MSSPEKIEIPGARAAYRSGAGTVLLRTTEDPELRKLSAVELVNEGGDEELRRYVIERHQPHELIIEGELWLNPERTFYTYRITAEGSDKYYIGYSHAKHANATEEELLRDGYYGSGGDSEGNKFFNWRKRHRTVRKEILGIFDRRSEALAHEEELVGNAWRDDPLCLNSVPGGASGYLLT